MSEEATDALVLYRIVSEDDLACGITDLGAIAAGTVDAPPFAPQGYRAVRMFSSDEPALMEDVRRFSESDARCKAIQIDRSQEIGEERLVRAVRGRKIARVTSGQSARGAVYHAIVLAPTVKRPLECVFVEGACDDRIVGRRVDDVRSLDDGSHVLVVRSSVKRAEASEIVFRLASSVPVLRRSPVRAVEGGA